MTNKHTMSVNTFFKTKLNQPCPDLRDLTPQQITNLGYFLNYHDSGGRIFPGRKFLFGAIELTSSYSKNVSYSVLTITFEYHEGSLAELTGADSELDADYRDELSKMINTKMVGMQITDK